MTKGNGVEDTTSNCTNSSLKHCPSDGLHIIRMPDDTISKKLTTRTPQKEGAEVRGWGQTARNRANGDEPWSRRII